MKTLSMFAALTTLALGATAALGHDFWLLPSSFAPKIGEVVKVGLRVGDEFPGEVVKRDDSRIVLFAAMPEGKTADSRPLVGRDGDPVAGLLRSEKEGTQVLAYRSTPVPITLEPQKFESYLREEGLEAISKIRAQRGQTDTPGRERYSRSVKSIVNVGGKATTGATTPVGLRLEITPDQDPATIKPGEKLSVTVTFDGKPLAEALVGARTPADDKSHQVQRTDQRGKVTFTLDHPGMWLLHSVHMIEVPKESGADSGADWESTWSSLTFELPEAR